MRICKSAYTLKDFTTKLLILYTLNVMDLLFTKILLNTGDFIEANYILRYIINDDFLREENQIFL